MKLADFNKPPYLINCKDETSERGFRCGSFQVKKGDIVFCASDALSHYILMMYELAHCNEYAEELKEAETLGARESTFIKNASQRGINFYTDVVQKLVSCKTADLFEQMLTQLYEDRLIAFDDYSFTCKIVE